VSSIWFCTGMGTRRFSGFSWLNRKFSGRFWLKSSVVPGGYSGFFRCPFFVLQYILVSQEVLAGHNVTKEVIESNPCEGEERYRNPFIFRYGHFHILSKSQRQKYIRCMERLVKNELNLRYNS